MSKIPSFQFYPGDWMKDPAVRQCSLAARGLWTDMLCLMFESPRRGYLQQANGQPLSHLQLARMTGCTSEEAAHLVQELDDAGVCSRTEHGVIYSRRIVRDEHKRELCREAGKRGGGNPRIQQLSSTFKGQVKRRDKGSIKRNANPSSSSSTSTTEKQKQIPSRDKREVDPRKAAFRDALGKYYAFKNPGLQLPWDGAAAKQLDLLISASPDLTLEIFQRCLNNRGKSDVVHSEPVHLWLRNALIYNNGPLNPYNRPKNLGGNEHGRAQGNSSPALDRAARGKAALNSAAESLGWVETGDADGADQGVLPEPGIRPGHDEGVSFRPGSAGHEVQPSDGAGRAAAHPIAATPEVLSSPNGSRRGA